MAADRPWVSLAASLTEGGAGALRRAAVMAERGLRRGIELSGPEVEQHRGDDAPLGLLFLRAIGLDHRLGHGRVRAADGRRRAVAVRRVVFELSHAR